MKCGGRCTLKTPGWGPQVVVEVCVRRAGGGGRWEPVCAVVWSKTQAGAGATQVPGRATQGGGSRELSNRWCGVATPVPRGGVRWMRERNQRLFSRRCSAVVCR